MATPTARAEEIDSLASLEERIHRAVQVVSQLRQEKDTIQKLFEEAVAEKEAGDKTLADLREQNKLLSEEVDELKAERRQVRSRIEKLLGQMDMLSAT
jgi:seryl-tRNA synthetase